MDIDGGAGVRHTLNATSARRPLGYHKTDDRLHVAHGKPETCDGSFRGVATSLSQYRCFSVSLVNLEF